MKIAYVQNHPLFGEKQNNFAEIEKLTENLTADILVLPELFATGYTFTSRAEAEALGETTSGETAEFLKKLSLKTGAVIVAGFVELENDKVYNSSLIIEGNQVIDTYRKIHSFNRETLWFDAGDKPLKVYDVKGIKMGVMICFDYFFPEVCRELTLQGMQVLAHPCNLVMPYCQKAMVTRCLENRIFAITANRIGNEKRGEDDFTFTGASQITAFNGEVLSSAPLNTPSVSIVEIEPEKALNKSINPYNDLLAQVRPEFYPSLTKPFQS